MKLSELQFVSQERGSTITEQVQSRLVYKMGPRFAKQINIGQQTTGGSKEQYKRFTHSHSTLKPIAHWLIQRSSAIFIVITLLLAPLWFVLFALNILVFSHLYLGIEEILADYVHNEVIGNLFLKLFQIFILISIKYVFVLFML
jgi:succinate dehydrogenase hydrophobic anchor subunit